MPDSPLAPGGGPPELGIDGAPLLADDSDPALLSELLCEELLSDWLSDWLSELLSDWLCELLSELGGGLDEDGGLLDELGGDELGGVGGCGMVGLLALGQPLNTRQAEATPVTRARL